MMIFIQCLLLVAVILLVLALYTMHQAGKAMDWFSCYGNDRKFKKHFEHENVMVFINSIEQEVTFMFSVRGKTENKKVSFVDALKIMNETEGGGVRKRLHQLK